MRSVLVGGSLTGRGLLFAEFCYINGLAGIGLVDGGETCSG